MSSYKIYKAQFDNAKKLGVSIKPSENKHKKIDVFNKDNKKIASIGSIRYQDYHSYIKLKGKDYAETRRRLYKIRHNKTRGTPGTNSYYADRILWD
tara:strand:+ start:1042 stop:1329 length:288 start_codon:yes stop_codon:yes gene_type:complete